MQKFRQAFHDSPGTPSFIIPVQLRAEVLAPVSNVDFLFPPPEESIVRIGDFAPSTISSEFQEELLGLEPVNGLSENLTQVPSFICSTNLTPPLTITTSSDLATQEAPETTRVVLGAFHHALLSPNLFQPLGRPNRLAGKRYSDASASAIIQTDIFPTERDPSGYRRSYREQVISRTKINRTILTIWDLILPLLQPPVRIDFPAVVDLPSPLYRYQIDGVKFLLEQESALLGDDMGTGKTVQSIVAMRMLFQLGKIKSALIVSPLSVLRNWDRELEKWAPSLSVTVLRGSPEGRETSWRAPAHVRITTYDTLRNDVDSIRVLTRYGLGGGDSLAFDLVILDECQTIKNPSTGISQAVRKLTAPRKWGLSGTPIENRLEELASIFAFIKPGLLSADGLTSEKARNKIAPHFLRRRKVDVLPDLPPKIDYEIWLPLEAEQRRAYESAESAGVVYLQSLGQEVTVKHVLALLTKLKQLCNVEPQTCESAKLNWLRDNLGEIFEKKDKALIHSQYREESGVRWLERELREFNPLSYVGGLSDRQRQQVLDTFEKSVEHPILLITRAGGLGLNLTAANYVIHTDHWWNPASTAQITDRTHRLGQRKNVFVYHLWTEKTVEERIYRIVERKRRLYDEVIDVLSNVQGTGLSETELFELFGLRPPQRARAAEDFGVERPEDLLTLTPDGFEKIVADLYRRLGYGVRVTGRTRDGGIDLVATSQVPGGVEKIAIQCKRLTRPVPVEYARELLGVISSDTTITKGVLVSATTFTDDCRTFCEYNGRLDLIDGPALIRLLNS